MLRFITYLICLGLLIAGAVWLADNPGAVAADWLGWRIETSVPVLLAALAIIVIIFTLVFRLLLRLLRWPSAWSAARRQRRVRKGYLALTDGLAAIAGGDARAAGKLAGRAEKLLADPALTRLLSAQAAQLTGKDEEARSQFTAMLERPETAALGLRGLLRQALEQGDDEAAIDLASRARRISPADPWLVDTLEDLLIRHGRLENAEELLDDAIRRKALTRDAGLQRKAHVLQERATAAEAQGDARSAMDFARRALKTDPTLTAASVCLARQMAAAGKIRQATAVLEKAWGRQPEPSLLAAFDALVPGQDPLARVRRLEKFIAGRPDDVDGHLLLGEACFAAKLWGKARGHLLAAAEARPNAATYRLLARLEQAEYNNASAAQAWLDKAAANP